MKIILNPDEVSEMVLDRCKINKYSSDEAHRGTRFVFKRNRGTEVFHESDLVEISVEFEEVTLTIEGAE